MKKFSYILAVGLCMLTLNACHSLLDQQPYGQFTENQMDENAVEGLMAAAYAGLNPHFFEDNNCAFAGPSTNWIFDVRSDDALKGGGGISMEGNIHQYEISNIFSDNVSAKYKWQNDYYAIARIHRTMLAIENAQSIANKNQYIGELKVLRAFFYFDLNNLFLHIPYITETDDASTVNNTTYSHEEIYKFIQKDLREAFYMMDESSPSAGRFNRYAAAALLAKAFAFTQTWDSVAYYADQVISSGKYELYPRYQDMSSIDMNNRYESIIAMQCSTADDYAHFNRSNLLNVTYSETNLYGIGDDFFYGSQNLVDAFQTDASGLPYIETSATTHVSATYTGNIDPRVDFTVGRIGIPFRGYIYNDKWCRAKDVYGEYSNKKCCANPDDERVSREWPWGGAPLNWCFLRYADVLLLRAEAAVELNDLGTALVRVNEVRDKAKRSIDATYYPVDIDETVANYKVEPYPSFPSQDYARKAVRIERRLELALEGHRWFDLVRWGVAAETMNAFFASEAAFHSYYDGAQVTQDEIYLPTPYDEVLNSNGLYK